VVGDRLVRLGGRRIRGLHRRLVALDEDVDRVERERVDVLAAPVGAGEVLAHLDDQQPVGIGRGPAHLSHVGAGVQGQAHVPVGVRERPGGDHHPRGQRREEREEPAEVGGREPDVGAAVAQQPFERPVEPAQVVDVRMGEEVGQHREQRAVDPQVLPVRAAAQRLDERRRLSGPERHPDGVDLGGSARPPRRR
jgi:hypothetical protein